MSKLDLIIKALQVSYAHVPGDIADRHHEALVAARELQTESAEHEPPFKLTDAGAGTNITRGMEPKGSGMVALNQPVAWHHPDCAGECIACLIEKVVTEAYGTQGLDYLHKKIAASPRKEWAGLTDDEEIKLDEKYGDDINAYIDARDAKLKEKNG